MYVPTRNLFGEGQLSGLHEQKLPGTKAMIVISNGKSTKENGALERIEKELSLAGGTRKGMTLTKEPIDFITALAKVQEGYGRSVLL